MLSFYVQEQERCSCFRHTA